MAHETFSDFPRPSPPLLFPHRGREVQTRQAVCEEGRLGRVWSERKEPVLRRGQHHLPPLTSSGNVLPPGQSVVSSPPLPFPVTPSSLVALTTTQIQ